MRRLLPYEHQLVEHLKISEQEYLDFLALQHDYTLSPEQKLEELQAGPAAPAIALVLTIVGTLFQVAAALLAPKPEQEKQGRTRREQQFAPRFGFNSVQDLAKYGDTVNLIYTNIDDNDQGGVRAGTSLVWSAVQCFGSSQFMQSLLVLGAGEIENIDPLKIAFGQSSIRQFYTQKTWTYFNPNGQVRFSNSNTPDAADPSRAGLGSNDYAYQITKIGTQKAEGFSQSFSPSSLNRFGIYAVVPIRVQVEDRADTGKVYGRDNGVVVIGLSTYWPDLSATEQRIPVPVGFRFTMRFKTTSGAVAKDVDQSARDQRRALLASIDGGSIYKLGSAKFKVVGRVDNDNIERDNIDIPFECIESGLCPQEDYATEKYQDNRAELEQFIIDLQNINASLKDQLLLNPPIYLGSIAPQVANLEGLANAANNLVEDLRALRKGVSKLRNLDASPYYDSQINNQIYYIDTIELEIERLREKRRDSDDDTKKDDITNKIQEQKRILKREERVLKRAIIEYGLNVDTDDGGRNIKDRIKILKAQITNYSSQLRLLRGPEFLDQTAMTNRNNGISSQIAANENRIRSFERDLANPEEWNDYFNTKCLVKYEEASYTTITNCNIVDFAIKAKVFKRVAGRAKKYADVKVNEYNISDNGIKTRSAYFWLWYRRETEADGKWQRVPRIFVVRRSAEVDNFISLKFIAADLAGAWEFKFDAIAETAAEMRYHGLSDFAYIQNAGEVKEILLPGNHKVTFRGDLKERVDRYQSPRNDNPAFLDEWGLFSMRSDTQLTFSFDQGPEFQITAVTEQREEPFSNYPNLYNGLAMLGFNTYSGQGIQDLRAITVFVNKGRKVRRLRDDGTYPSTPDGASSFAPDIFLDTILDNRDGIGQYAKVAGIDLRQLAVAKRFCRVNRFFMDGVIADQTPWRQFWAEVAPYSLLELAKVGGKETLLPAVPCDNAGQIQRRITISSMFTAGNILEDSYKEEFMDYGTNVQDLIATVIFRRTRPNEDFPRNVSVEVSLNGVNEANAVRQTFDLSQFVTQRTQAITFAKLLCNQRRHIRRAIEFRTFPSAAVISPGSYIYVALGRNEWDNITSGVVEAGGVLNTPVAGTVANGTYSALLYRPSDAQATSLSGISVSGNVASALAGYEGWLFVLGSAVTNKRVFRVTEVTMDEEGEVGVRAVEHPCEISGNETLSRIANFDDALFTIR